MANALLPLGVVADILQGAAGKAPDWYSRQRCFSCLSALLLRLVLLGRDVMRRDFMRAIGRGLPAILPKVIPHSTQASNGDRECVTCDTANAKYSQMTYAKD